MRKTTLLYAPILAFLALFALAFSAWADAALPPPRWIQPYAEQQAGISCRMSGTELLILLSVPGPCEYACTVYGPDSEAITAASASGSLEKFGPQTAVFPVPLTSIGKGKAARYRLLASGNYYRYKKLRASKKDIMPNWLFGAVIGDPHYRYELIDKKGEPFSFDIAFNVARDNNGRYSIASPMGEPAFPPSLLPYRHQR